MQFQRLTPDQRAVKRWRDRVARVVARIMAADRHITSYDAVREAERRVGPMPEGPPARKPVVKKKKKKKRPHCSPSRRRFLREMRRRRRKRLAVGAGVAPGRGEPGRGEPGRGCDPSLRHPDPKVRHDPDDRQLPQTGHPPHADSAAAVGDHDAAAVAGGPPAV